MTKRSRKTSTCTNLLVNVLTLVGVVGVVSATLSSVTAETTFQWRSTSDTSATHSAAAEYFRQDLTTGTTTSMPTSRKMSAPAYRKQTNQQDPTKSASQASAPSAASAATSNAMCAGNGIQLCRCYCRVDLRRCTNNSVSYVSTPLCRDPWNGTNCPSIGYFQSGATDATSCAAFDGRACEGYARPGDLPAGVTGKLQGQFLGCTMAAF